MSGAASSAGGSRRAGGTGDTPLDGEHIDVYQGAHAALVMYDVRTRASWEAARALLREVPPALPALLVGNFRDAGGV